MWRPAFRPVIALALAASLALTACGCGPPSSGGDGGGGGGADAARTAALDSIAAKFGTFDGADPDQENEQMLAFLQARPEFTETGLDDTGTTWGRFADGTTLIVGNNLDVTQRTPQAAMPALSSRSAAPGSRAGGIPNSLDVVLGVSLGNFWEQFCQVIPEMFAAQNYNRITPDTTVDALKSLNDVSVLYLLTHGGAATLRSGEGGRTYAVWTSTLRARDGSTDLRYHDDLQDGSLVYFMSAAFHLDPAGGDPRPVMETHYALTDRFVTKYWTGKFHKDSLVFMNTCGSSSLAALQFKSAFAAAGASVYLGWTDKMILGDGVTSAAYLFDRLLGTNQDLSNEWSPTDGKESPPQRPFNYPAVLVEMGTRPRAGGATMYDATFNPKTGKTAKLEMFPLSFEFMQLAPSIERLFVDEQKDELTIVGLFGSTAADAMVTIGTTELRIKSWSGNQIVCELPRSGGGASGDVMVTINASAQHSNVVQLTEWTGTVTCTYESDGTLEAVWTFDLHFRADVHSSRIGPHQTPLMTGANYLHALDSSGTYVFSGSYTSDDGFYEEDWSGSGDVPAFVRPPEGTFPPEVNNVVLEGGFDENRNWRMAIRAFAVKGHRIHTVLRDTQGLVSDRTEDYDGIWQSVDDLNGNPTLAAVSQGFDIPGGTKTHAINADESLTLTWSAMAARNAPAADAARSAH